MQFLTVVLASSMVFVAASAASASTASQREYKRGYADCSKGAYDQDQHGASYTKGCRAAEDKIKAKGKGKGAAAPASDSVPAKDKKACLAAVKKQTRNPKVTVLGAESSEANNSVKVGVGPQRAPWRCLVKDGRVADVMSLTDEGKL